MKLFKTLILTLVIFLAGTSMLWAEEIVPKSLDEVFDQVLILPFDYRNKVFSNGRKTDFYGEYELFQRDGRVLVPVRLMGYLVAGLEKEAKTLDVAPQKIGGRIVLPLRGIG